MINIDSLVKSIIKPLLIENLDEAKQLGIIYHFTSINSDKTKGIFSILDSNKFLGSEISVLPLGNVHDRDFQPFGKSGKKYIDKGVDKLYYLSTTRDKFLYKKNPKIKGSTVRIVLDGDKLSNKYKIQPFYYYSDEMIDEPAPKHDQDESEERILLGTKNEIDLASNYIKEVQVILDKVYDNEDYLNLIEELIKKYPEVECYYKEKPIKLEDYINNIVPTIEPYRYDDDIFESVVTSDLTFDKALDSLVKYMADQGMNIQPLPALKIINNDVENANNILGKTAYYDPNNCSITLYTLNRHPKDILRSFSHEMIHRIQDNEGRLNNINTTNTNEDGDLPELEKEAYLKGNMTFRNWEDSIKNQKYIREYKEYALNELFEKDLPNIKKISPTKYIVGNEDDIEAEYFFKIEFDIFDENPTPNNWSVNWRFTDNNQNTSPEAWKQVTATSFKVLNDFIQDKKPKSITISGNTEAKTNIYKSESFLKKLETLFNNQYKIDNSNEDKIVINLIENISQSNVQKRMDTLNESYEQALDYWQNGDLNSKSKIERWNAIKRKIEREVLQEIYQIK
jgi:hypothetical protein